MSEMIIHQRRYTYTVQRQQRKTLQLQILAPETLHIKAPIKLPLAEIIAFVQKKADWIHLKNQTVKTTIIESAAPVLDHGSILLYKGNRLTLEVKKTFCKPKISLRGDRLLVNLYLPDTQNLSALLKRWYIRQAADHLAKRTAYWCEKIGTEVQKISIKEQKTRWGSCSSLGNLNYNWRIIMAPEKTIDYLVIHEVSHRIHLNHSKQFWNLVAFHCPEYLEHRLWLKTHGHQLQNII